MVHRFRKLMRRVFGRKGDETTEHGREPSPAPSRPPTESEIDEAARESFPASDPPALSLEKKPGKQARGSP